MALVILWLTAACGAVPSPPPSVVATPTPTPSPTPNPHLSGPATADQVYLALLEDGLAISGNTAVAGSEGRDPVKRIEGTYLGWSLSIGQYRSEKTLHDADPWKDGALPAAGDRPLSIKGLNILVEWGPKNVGAPTKPDESQLVGASTLRFALDSLLSPLLVRSVVAVAGPTPTPGPSASPAASPQPTKKPPPKPTKKPSPRPTKKPKS